MSASKTAEEFQYRGKPNAVWHMLNSEWGALCGSAEAADSENHKHSLTNRAERITCEKCRAIMEADKPVPDPVKRDFSLTTKEGRMNLFNSAVESIAKKANK